MARGRYRLQDFDYRANRWYFVTTVTARREHSLGRIEGTELCSTPLGQIVEAEIVALTLRRPNVQVPVAVAMPNHVHLLIGLANDSALNGPSRFGKVGQDSLSAVIGGWKSGVSRRARCELGLDAEVWQRRFHDRVVRNLQEWEGIADYILWNRVNWHLDPLSGSVEPTDAEVSDWKRRLGM